MNDNHSTNTTVIGLGGAVSLIVVGLLHYFVPDFMTTIGSSGDIAIGTIVTAALGYYLPATFLQAGSGNK